MARDYLEHHGIKGMRWGVRRSKKQLGYDTSSKKEKRKFEEPSKPKEAIKSKTKAKKSVSEMSDAELASKIRRLEMEKRYSDLSRDPKRNSRGKKFVIDVLESSGRNIATQAVTYGMGTAVNRIFNDKIVNPKKGQKDK